VIQVRAYASIALAIAAVIAANAAIAQDLQAPNRGERLYVFDIRLVDGPGKPLTVKSARETIRPLKEGKLEVSHGLLIQSRDSRGRIYRYLKLSPLENSNELPIEEITLFDATAGTQTFCPLAPVAPRDNGKHCYVTNYRSPELSSRSYCARTPVPSDTVTWTNLGNYQLGGVTVTHTRELCTHDGGEITGGLEFWRNSDLQLELTVVPRRSPLQDPMIDDRVTEVTQAEPDPRIFDVPDGFTVIDKRKSNPPE
jgi:hypothetical protein